MLGGLRTVVVRVPDVQLARDWYVQLLGYEPYFDQPFYVGFSVGGYELGLQPGGSGQPSPASPIAYWSVPDCAVAVTRLVELGAKVVSPVTNVGGQIELATVLDPFGNQLGVIYNPDYCAEVGAAVAAGCGQLAELELSCEAHVAANVDEVWRLWTTSAGLAEWLAPARVQLRVGGAYEVRFLPDNPPGTRGSEGCRVLSVLPHRMLSFTWNAPPHLSTRRQLTWVVVQLREADGGTVVKLTHTGWPQALATDPEWAATFEYFQSAWSRALQALEARCQL